MDKLIRYLKQRVPHRYIEIPDDIEQLENQESLLTELKEDLKRNPAYFKLIFKKILELQQLKNFEILDDFYSTYIESLLPSVELSPLDHDILQYQVSPGKQITIKENPKLISGLNTTGLRTWELSIYLAHYLLNDYLLQHPEVHTVLELGTGTGLVGLTLNKYTDTCTYMTDGDSHLIQNLSDNFTMNGLNTERCFQYIWGEELYLRDIDLCVGADITYDVSILESLLQSIKTLFQHCHTKTVLIACTIRNELTLDQFDKLLTESQFQYHKTPTTTVPLMFLNPSSEIIIYEITPGRGPQ